MLAKGIEEDLKNASAIRKMFEEGLELKKKYGAENVADFSLGNPLIEPPEEFITALTDYAKSGQKGLHQYMPNMGYPKTREAIANDLNSKGYFNNISANEIMMCVGAAGGLNVTLKTVLNKGEEVITIAPYFPEYRFYTKNHNGKHVIVSSAEDFTLDVDAIAKAITKKTRAIIVNSPNNPTGVIYSKKSLEEFASMLSQKESKLKRDIYLLSDEPYRELVYQGSYTSPASLHKNSFMIYSWSKSLSLPGERIGYVAVNPEMKFKDDILKGLPFCNRTLGFINAPALMQNIIPKLLDSKLDVNYYKKMRDDLITCLEKNGYQFAKPDGAFYLWVKCPTPGKDVAAEEKAFIDDMKSNFLFLLGPGSTFGKPGWFRISYSVNPSVISLGCKKLEEVAKKYMGKECCKDCKC